MALLLKNHSETTALLSKQLDALKDFLDPANSETPHALEVLTERFDAWEKYTTMLLDNLFTTDELAQEFFHDDITVSVTNLNHKEAQSDFWVDVKHRRKRLASIIERLPLFEMQTITSTPAEQAKLGASEINKSSTPTKSNGLQTAIVVCICAALASTLALVFCLSLPHSIQWPIVAAYAGGLAGFVGLRYSQNWMVLFLTFLGGGCIGKAGFSFSFHAKASHTEPSGKQGFIDVLWTTSTLIDLGLLVVGLVILKYAIELYRNEQRIVAEQNTTSFWQWGGWPWNWWQ